MDEEGVFGTSASACVRDRVYLCVYLVCMYCLRPYERACVSIVSVCFRAGARGHVCVWYVCLWAFAHVPESVCA